MTCGDFHDPPVLPAACSPIGTDDVTTPRAWAEFVSGRQFNHYIKPAKYVTPRLAATLADKWLELSSELGSGSTLTLATAIRQFLDLLRSQVRDLERDAGFDVGDLRRRHLDAWEIDLLGQQRQTKTDTAYRHNIYVLALLRRIEDDKPGSLHETVRRRREAVPRLPHIRRKAEAEFSTNEVRLMRDVARRLVNVAFKAHKLHDRPPAPSPDVIVALHVLLSLGTGEPPEVLRKVELGDIVATARPGRDAGLDILSPEDRLAVLVDRRGVDT